MRTWFLLAAGLAAAGALLAACHSPAVPLPDGAVLARTHCASCHAMPEPSLLGKDAWREHVLPRMGYLYGIFPDTALRRQLLADTLGGQAVRAAGLFPPSPVIDTAVWNRICAYYLAAAPDTLPRPAAAAPQPLTQFRVRIPAYRFSPPSSTMARFAPGGGILLGDAHTGSIYQFDSQLNMRQAAALGEGPVWAEALGDALLVTVMGSFSPTDAASGSVVALSDRRQTVLGGLQRPVHTQTDDFNGDGKADLLVCEFAKWTGKLAWWEFKGPGQFEPHVLRAGPGALRAYVRDFNRDQRPDIIALFGQGDEGVSIWYNEGHGVFREERVLRFPASWGSSFLDLVDFNGDGHEDLLYTAGDNADYPPVLKPYHGIRIYLNDGQNRFTESFFYPMHGAYGAAARDFDGDGDLDLAAVSFFPDFQQAPASGFLYLENRGAEGFAPFTFPEAVRGRWITLDAGDPDGDGDQDLLLGSMAFEVVPPSPLLGRWVEEGIPFVWLENRQK